MTTIVTLRKKAQSRAQYLGHDMRWRISRAPIALGVGVCCRCFRWALCKDNEIRGEALKRRCYR